MNRPLFALALLLPACAAPPAVESSPASAPGVRRFGTDESPPKAPGTIRLATYNVLNLFDHEDDPDLSGEIDDMILAVDDARCHELAAAIRAVDADVLALQEIESLEALRWFRDTYLPDLKYEHLASEDVGYYRGVECSVMSRIPIVAARTWPGMSLDGSERPGAGWATPPEDPMLYRRSPLMVDLRTAEGYELTVFCIHHKAGRDHDAWREAEAIRTIELIRRRASEEAGRNIAVMGDFNAAPWDKSVRVYLAAGLVDTLAHRATRGEEAALTVTHESERVIDYVLLNSGAYRELVVGSPHVYGTLVPPETYDWRTDAPPEGYASDHYPVVVDLVAHDR